MHHEHMHHQNSCNTVFLRDMVCLRNISVDTLHKGDTEDKKINNNNNNKILIIPTEICAKLMEFFSAKNITALKELLVLLLLLLLLLLYILFTYSMEQRPS